MSDKSRTATPAPAPS